jgi:hypothetical protein
VVGVFAGYVGDLFNFSLLYYFLGCFFLPFLFPFIVIYVYAYEYYIFIHYLLFVTLCGQFCSWVNKSYYYYYYYYFLTNFLQNLASCQTSFKS